MRAGAPRDAWGRERRAGNGQLWRGLGRNVGPSLRILGRLNRGRGGGVALPELLDRIKSAN